MSLNYKNRYRIKLYVWPLLFGVLGFSLSTNVINVFRIGTVNVSIAQTLVLIMSIILAFKRGVSITTFWRALKASMKMWLLLVPLSFFAIILNSVLSLSKSFFAGLIELISVLLSILLIANLPMYTKQLMKGMIWGLLINIIVSLLAYVKWKVTGSSINFGEIFHLESYATYNTSYYFRSQGLFTESSFFVCYLCIITPIALLIKPVKRINNIILIVLSIAAIALSLSGNILIYFIELFICFLLIGKYKNREVFRPINILGVLLIGIVFFIFLAQSGRLTQFWANIRLGLAGANLFNEGNSPRIQNMRAAIEVFKESNLIGYGYNMGATVMSYRTIANTGAASTFLRMLLDLGVVGGLVYLWVFYQYCIHDLLSKRTTLLKKSIACGMIGLFSCQVSNGYPFASVLTMVMFGLVAVVNEESYLNE